MKFKSYNNLSFKKTDYYNRLPPKEKEAFDILSTVFHFKTNNYVLEKLIDWKNVETDSIYRLIFPRKEMLNPADYEQLTLMHKAGISMESLGPFIETIRKKMSPKLKYPEKSIPKLNGLKLQGAWQNFGTIINLYPDPMVKTCHAYCSYCFRWIMFKNTEVQNSNSYSDPNTPVEYIRSHPEITDVLFTGADPLVIKADKIKEYIDPILAIDSVKVIRISTKSLGWWPYRFTTDSDADELLSLFEYIISKGKHLNICAHVTHVKELENEIVQKAIKRIQATGAIIRCQGPIVKGINDTAEDWINLWNKQIQLGLIPYYMFVEAEHNSENCFRIPLAKGLNIFQTAQKQATGLARTVRGPVFMNDHHRILIDGVITIQNEKFFVLKSLQAPPNTKGEGSLKLIPYDENTKDPGDLVALFSEDYEKELTY
ncbi:KamA family radical SAM protein [Xanthovirga aplysinae]|uniref:KamA family radical SAM protein n=1 Tax=Xanthovirga aplysinae TaxID=2529853 RepID=UPI0012BCC6CF|nr:lysine 2,3-aminomutase [Xanthovirga aplysinae]MTI32498.1 lysine 2,3-aminomutase [Xanthovirga aplysinae]